MGRKKGVHNVSRMTLAQLRVKHKELDVHLLAEQRRPRPDETTVKRLKILKRIYKDQMARLERSASEPPQSKTTVPPEVPPVSNQEDAHRGVFPSGGVTSIDFGRHPSLPVAKQQLQAAAA